MHARFVVASGGRARRSDAARRPQSAPAPRAPRPRVVGEPDAVPVLVVDDSPDFLRVARQTLERAGVRFAVHTVQSGTEALDFLSHRPPFTAAPQPAFVILDFNLPDLDAPAVLERLRANSVLRGIPVLVLTQAAWAEDEQAARAAGARLYAAKPSRVRGLRDLVVRFWREQCAAGEDPPG